MNPSQYLTDPLDQIIVISLMKIFLICVVFAKIIRSISRLRLKLYIDHRFFL